MSTEAPLRLALLGCGFATELAAKALRGVSSEVVCAYASRDPERAEAFRRRHAGYRAFGSYAAALDSPNVDAVFVATPPATHLELTLQALRAGKHAIVEKPPFLRASDFDTIETEQRATGRRVFVAENYFYKPLARRLRRLLAEDVLGPVQFVIVNALKGQADAGWRSNPELAGGGALFEGGIHWINLLANLGLEVKAASGFAACLEGGSERSIMAVFEYAQGAVGTLHYSWQVPSPLKGLRISRIYGRRGSLAFESNGLFGAVWGARKQLFFPGFKDLTGRAAMFKDFVSALRSGHEPAMNLSLARRDLELVEAVTSSALSAARKGGAA